MVLTHSGLRPGHLLGHLYACVDNKNCRVDGLGNVRWQIIQKQPKWFDNSKKFTEQFVQQMILIDV